VWNESGKLFESAMKHWKMGCWSRRTGSPNGLVGRRTQTSPSRRCFAAVFSWQENQASAGLCSRPGFF
jgi:hypothetical protein